MALRALKRTIMNNPLVLLETRTDPMTILTSRSLVIKSISSQGTALEFCYTNQDIAEHVCYGQSYMLLENPRADLVIKAILGDEEIDYVFKL